MVFPVSSPIVGILGVVCFAVLPTTRAAQCPPVKSQTVDVNCSFAGSPFNCTALPSAPGTTARFKCRALHEPLFGYLPAAGFESQCGPEGEWSVRPFRCVPICGRPTGQPKALVRDGKQVKAAWFPWHVVVYDVLLDMRQICGGSLITAKYFVSAAHCFHDDKKAMPPTQFMAGFARTKRDASIEEPNSQFREIAKIHMKDYGTRKLHYINDVALVELINEVDVTAWTLPVCVDWALDLPDLRNGQEGTVVGFGDTFEKTSEVLLYANLPFVRGDVCKSKVSDKLAIFSVLTDKYCVGFYNNTSVSSGDSGGGMAFPTDDRIWYLRGVVSVGLPSETTYTYFTNVTAYVPWISGIIQQGELSGRRCGVDVAEASVVNGAIADKQDFPWEVDVYFKPTSKRSFERMWSGVLVKPNLVLTSVLRLPTEEDSSQIDLSEYPATWFRVASRRNTDSLLLEKASNVSEVVLHFYPEDVILKYAIIYNFILLELKQPLHLMPVCVDWTGSALLQIRTVGTTFLEIPENNTRIWMKYPILSSDQCKPKQTPPPDSYNICTFHEGKEPPHRSRSLLVNVDNSWFLRGLWSFSSDFGNGSVARFTDMSDPGVLQWLAKTIDQLGKPACGDVNVCESLSPGKSLPGHMPWTVSVVVKDDNNVSVNRGGGLLIQQNAILTDSAHIANASGWDGQGMFPVAPVDKISILFTGQDGVSQISSVVRASVHENSVLYNNGSRRYDVALLELAREDAIYSTPVCLDLSGRVLQQLGDGQLGLAESWSTWNPANHSLVITPYIGLTECANDLQRSQYDFSGRSQFCTAVQRGLIGDTTRGSGFLSYTGSKWYLQGLFTDYVKLRKTTVLMATDLRDGEIRTWLRKKLDMIESLEQVPDDKGTKNCEGGTPQTSQCGIFASLSENSEGDDYLIQTTINHMPWSVDVHVDDGTGRWLVRAGTVIKPTMVLTSAVRLVSSNAANVSGDVRTISTGDIIVKYVSPDQRNRRIAEVLRIHVRERTKGPDNDFRYDLALLEVKPAVQLVPVCVPAPGWVGSVVPPLAEGSRGLVEFWRDTINTIRNLVPTIFRTRRECAQLLPKVDPVSFADDEFCSQPVEEPTTAGMADKMPLGSALSVATDGVWFLRGVQASYWDGEEDGDTTVYAFVKLDDPDVLEWLAEKMGVIARTGSPPVPPRAPPTTSTTTTNTTTTTTTTTTTQRPLPTEPPPPTKCGQTSVALHTLASNETLTGHHLPWNVAVVKVRENDLDMSAGVLVRDDLVLTAGHVLVTPTNKWNHSGDVHAMDRSKVHVVWVSPSGSRQRLEVAAIHVHERDRGPISDLPWDVALLQLKKPIRGSGLACLDLDEDAEEAPATGKLGVFETWRGNFFNDHRILVASLAVGAAECLRKQPNIPPDHLMSDRFCSEQLSDAVWDGAAFLQQRGDSWFVRGIKSCMWGNDNGPYGITDLSEASVRDWLRNMIPSTPTPRPRVPVQNRGVATLYFSE